MLQTTLLWSEGQLMAFSALEGETSYENGIVARTMPDGLEVKIPSQARITFPRSSGSGSFGGDHFSVGGCKGVLVDTYNLLISGEVHIENAGGFEVLQGNGVTLFSVSGKQDLQLLTCDFDKLYSSREKWLDKAKKPANLPGQMEGFYRKVCTVMKSQLYTPEGRIKHRWSTPDRFPHQQMWLWDSAFHAIGWRHTDPDLARDLLSAVFDCQCADGFIPHMMTPNGQSDITQPPILAYGMIKVHEVDEDLDWLRELYEPVQKYLEWNLKNRDSDGFGLLEWFIEGDPSCRSGESGMDNSPRFDAATQMDAVDFNCFMAKEYDCLAVMADALGCEADALKWKSVADSIRDKINERLWNEERGFYYDYDVDNNSFCEVSGVSGFLPLFCGAVDEQKLPRLLELMDDPEAFGTPLPLPSVSRSDSTFGFDMWRGPAWMNMAWLIAEGLADYGFPQKAEMLRSVWLQTVQKYYNQCGSIYEYYDALDERTPLQLPRKKKTGEFPHQVVREFGWTVTLSMDWMWRRY